MNLVSSVLFSRMLQRETSVFSELKFKFYYSYYFCILTLICHPFCTFYSFQLYRKQKKLSATGQWRREKKIWTQNFRIQKNICHYMTEQILHVFFLHNTKIPFIYSNFKDKWKYYYHCKCFWSVLSEDLWRSVVDYSKESKNTKNWNPLIPWNIP